MKQVLAQQIKKAGTLDAARLEAINNAGVEGEENVFAFSFEGQEPFKLKIIVEDNNTISVAAL